MHGSPPRSRPILKIFIVLVLLIIVASLGSALYYLFKDRERSPRTVHALTVRIGLSIGLFLVLLIGFGAGLIKPHGLRPGFDPQPKPSSAPTKSSVPR
jgi:hypothetical protein